MKLEDLTYLSEMANLRPTRTGLPYVMWFGEVGGQHGPRIKVSNTPGRFNRGSNFSISVSPDPEVVTPPTSVEISRSELTQIFRWIQLNYDDLMLLWQIFETGDDAQLNDGTTLDDTDIIKRLKKIS